MPGVAVRTDLFLPTQEWLRENSSPVLWSFEGGGRAIASYELQLVPLYWLWDKLSNNLHFPIDLGRRIIWIFMYLAVGISSMYFLSWYITQDTSAASIASLYFLLNIMNIWAIHASWIQGPTALAFVPGSFLLFLKSLNENTAFGTALLSMLSGFILSIIMWYELKIAIIFLFILLSYCLFFICLNRRPLKPILALSLLFAVSFLLNAWIFLPYIISGSAALPQGAGQVGNIISQKNFYSLNLILEFFTKYGYVFIPLATLISCLLFIPILLAPSSYAIYFTLIALFLIVISSGGSGPLGFVYKIFYNHVPFFVAFRDINKFLLFLSFPVAILLGIAAKEIKERLLKRILHKERVLEVITLLLFILIFLFAVTPTFIGSHRFSKDNAGSVLKPKAMPEEMSFLYEWVKKVPNDYKILLYPGTSPFQITSLRHPGLGALYYTFSPLKDLALYFWMNPYGRQSVVKRNLTADFNKMLELLNIRYVVLYPTYEYMWGVIPGDSSQENADNIFRHNQFSKVNSPPELIIYENQNAKPLISSVSRLDLIVGGRNVYLPLLLLNYDFNDRCLLFNSQLREKALTLWKDLDCVIFYGKDLYDLMLSTLDDRYKIDLWHYARFSNNKPSTEQRPYNTWDKKDKDWIRYYSPYWINNDGEIQEGHNLGLVQAGTIAAGLYIEFEIPSDGIYEIWVRAGVGHDMWLLGDGGEASLYVDYVLQGSLNTYKGNVTGLKWVKLAAIYLKEGRHIIWLSNRRGINSLDQLAVIPEDSLSRHNERLCSLLKDKKLMFIFEGERNFSSEKGSSWNIGSYDNGRASQGYALSTQDEYAGIALINNADGYFKFETPYDNEYRIRMRVLNTGADSYISLSVDGREIFVSKVPARQDFVWLESKPAFLEKGAHSINIRKKGRGLFALDLVMVLDSNLDPLSLFKEYGDNGNNNIPWSIIDASKLEVYPNKDTKLILFNTNYDPSWHAKAANTAIESVIVNSWCNGFILGSNNKGKVLLDFKLQRFAKLGFRLFIMLLLIFVFLTLTFIVYFVISVRPGRRKIDKRI